MGWFQSKPKPAPDPPGTLRHTAQELKLAKSRTFWITFIVTAVIVGWLAYQQGHTAGWNAAAQCTRTIGSCNP